MQILYKKLARWKLEAVEMGMDDKSIALRAVFKESVDLVCFLRLNFVEVVVCLISEINDLQSVRKVQ